MDHAHSVAGQVSGLCYCGPATQGWCLWCAADSAKAQATELLAKGRLPGLVGAHVNDGGPLGLWSLSSGLPSANEDECHVGCVPPIQRQLVGSCPLLQSPAMAPLPRPRHILAPGTAKEGCWVTYRQGALLGSGAFGTTYQATKRKEPGKQYAIKMISKLKLSTPEEVEAVRREVHILTVLQGHPRVVRLYETYEDKHYVCLVMECCKGGDLHDAIANSGPASEERAAALFRPIMELVGHCHRQGIMHRDLKPDNFMLTSASPNAEVKGIDFGHSVFVEEGQRLSDLVGSVHYLAPEVINGSYGKEADLWSCGVILYCLLCGFPPFRGNTVQAIMDSITSGDHESKALKAWAGLSDSAKHLVRRLLQPDPALRATIDEVLQHEWMCSNSCSNNSNSSDGSSTSTSSCVMEGCRTAALRSPADAVSSTGGSPTAAKTTAVGLSVEAEGSNPSTASAREVLATSAADNNNTRPAPQAQQHATACLVATGADMVAAPLSHMLHSFGSSSNSSSSSIEGGCDDSCSGDKCSDDAHSSGSSNVSSTSSTNTRGCSFSSLPTP